MYINKKKYTTNGGAMYKTYTEAETAYMELWQGDQDKKLEAIEIAEYAFYNFEDKHHLIILDLIMYYGITENIDKCKAMFKKGFSKGFWYPEAYLKKLFEQEIYKDMKQAWCKLRDDAMLKAKSVYKTYLPNNYNSETEYPLFISLHGWGEDLNMFIEFWQSKQLSSDFIHVSIQSSQIFGSQRYQWDDTEKSRNEIYTVLEEIKAKHNTNTCALIGGFSQGGSLAMLLALEDPKVFKGFISLNPGKHKLITDEMITSAAGFDLKGSIITGDQDFEYKNQLELIETFKKYKLKCDLNVNKDFGHWFPENLSDKINESIDFICDK